MPFPPSPAGAMSSPDEKIMANARREARTRITSYNVCYTKLLRHLVVDMRLTLIEEGLEIDVSEDHDK